MLVTAAAALTAGSQLLPARVGYLPAGTEMVELRDDCARHYSNGDGTITAVVSAGPGDDTDLEQTAETFEYPFATGHCAYNGSEYGKNDMGLVKVEKEVILHPPQVTERVGWFKFDLASIPDSVTVTWARCRFIVTYFEMSMGLAFTCPDVDPVTTGAEALYNAIYEAEVCATGPMGRAIDSFQLGPIAAEHIQRSLSRDWVAFGLVGFNYSSIISKRGWMIGWNASPREHAPQLRVVYEPPSAVAEPGILPERPTFSITPNPVAGGEVHVRVQGLRGSRVRVTVHDAAGRTRREQAFVHRSASGDIPLDVRGLPNGVYLVRLEAGGRTERARLVVQR